MEEKSGADIYDRKLSFIKRNPHLALVIALFIINCITGQLLYNSLTDKITDLKDEKKELKETVKIYERLNMETDRAIKISTQKKNTSNVK